ncbi:tripartite motif-containing protein 16 [Danio rerio]|uniref:Tripartite motif-containing protein 16 n=1 Tax=Danio rerio TaxID=7955 RepID=A0A8M9PRK9_DANRE
MAEVRISVDQIEFMCPVCLDLLKDPVTLHCGHSYCKSCITDFWDQEYEKRIYSCPQCRQSFTPRPALAKNTMLAEVVEKLKKTKPPADCCAGAGDVQCDACTGRKYKAVKSCLQCQESYCQTHFERHEEFHSRKPHKVIDATGQLRDMICQKHGKELEIYCITDQQCICELCKEYEHKNHATVSTAEQMTEKQQELKERQVKLQQREKALRKLKNAVESQKRSAQTAVEDTEKIFTELIHSIQKKGTELTQVISSAEKTAVSQAEEHMEYLEQEIEDLRRRNAELERLSQTQEHVNFLQRFQSLPAPLESTDGYFSSFLCFDAMKESVHELKSKLENLCKEEIKMILDRVTSFVPKTRNDFLQYSIKLTLDLHTAHKCLSKKRKVVTCTKKEQPYPDHPDRFHDWPQVLCTERVRGRRYWEVEWSGDKGVCISASYKSISRTGTGNECAFGGNDHSWSLFCSPLRYLFWHNNIQSDLTVKPNSHKIGVYVNVGAGTLSFYNVSDEMSLIHTFQTTFTQPLFPGFTVGFGSSVKLKHR